MAYILVVEDDADTMELLCQVLRKAGHEVKGVPNGKEALLIVLNRIPDLVILDMFMPDMDGAGLLEILRSYLRLGSLPVIVYTGLPDSPLAERARHLRVNTMLIKGKATFDDIIAAVNHELPRAPR
jgi:CheY-like chemotaxis protein